MPAWCQLRWCLCGFPIGRWLVDDHLNKRDVTNTTAIYTVMERLKPNRRTRLPRQDPVSCQFCRSKKLKCDRRQPCSNCSARGVTCKGVARHALHQPQDDRHQSLFPENAEILVRLKALEDTVSAMRGGALLSPQPSQQTTPTTPTTRNNTDEDHRTASEWLENIGARGDTNVR